MIGPKFTMIFLSIFPPFFHIVPHPDNKKLVFSSTLGELFGLLKTGLQYMFTGLIQAQHSLF